MHLMNPMVNYWYRQYGVPIHDLLENGPELLVSCLKSLNCGVYQPRLTIELDYKCVGDIHVRSTSSDTDKVG